MPIIRNVQTNFTGGRIDAAMLGRVDTSMYQNGAEEMLNIDLDMQGGFRRRRGFRWMYDLAKRVRLVPFLFSETQVNILAFAVSEVRVFDVHGTLHQTISSAPWNTQGLVDGMRWDQRGDTMILCRGFRTQKLLRTAANTFSLSNFTFETDSSNVTKEPFFKYADADTTLTASATTGSITLTTSVDHWTSDHVGARVRYQSKQIDITGYTSATQVTGTVIETLPATAATDDWDESVFSDERGYANAVAFHSQRLWLAGPDALPAHVFGSRSSAFFNFDVETGEDNHSIQGPVGGNQVSNINHLVSSDVLFVVSDNGLVFLPETDASPLTPSTFNPKFVNAHGGSEVRPLVYDESIVYPQLTGRAVREVLRDEFTLRVKSRPVSFVATDVVRSIRESAVQYAQKERPSSLSYFVNFDGTVSIYQALRTEKFAAWHNWSTQGRILSMAAVNDRLFVCTERVFAGVAYFSLELANEDGTLDCAERIMVTDATDSFTLSSLSTMYASQSVSVVSIEENVIANGAFDDSTGWTLGTGWSVTGGKLVGAAGSASAAEISGLTAGTRYRIEGQMSSWTAGNLTIDAGYGASLSDISQGEVIGGNGDFSLDITCRGDGVLYLRKGSTGDFSLDNILVRELDDEERPVVKRRNHGTRSVTAGGVVTLPTDFTSKHIEVGLPYTPTVTMLPIADQVQVGSLLMEPKRVVSANLLLDRATNVTVAGRKVLFLTANDDLEDPTPPFTGAKRVYNRGWDRQGRIEITMPEPLPGAVLAVSREVVYSP